jgi:hypothetical protein
VREWALRIWWPIGLGAMLCFASTESESAADPCAGIRPDIIPSNFLERCRPSLKGVVRSRSVP